MIELDRSIYGVHDGFMVESVRRVPGNGPNSSIRSKKTCQGDQVGCGGLYRGSGELYSLLLVLGSLRSVLLVE